MKGPSGGHLTSASRLRVPGAPSGVGGGNPGDAGPAAGDHKEARERYRNALFDREAGGSGARGSGMKSYGFFHFSVKSWPVFTNPTHDTFG